MPQIDVYSDLQPKQVSEIGLAIFKVWTEFATGQRALGGRKLKQPTGTYASAIRMQKTGKNHVAVFVDTRAAPHAQYIETGHREVDMLDYLSPGGRYPMHRSQFMAGGGEARYAIHNGQRMTRRGSGVLRAGRFVPSMTGIVRTPQSRESVAGRMNTSGRGAAWMIPAMPAYSPARLIAALFSRRVSAIGGSITFTR